MQSGFVLLTVCLSLLVLYSAQDDDSGERRDRRRRTTTTTTQSPSVVCTGAPGCEPVPGIDCVTSYQYRTVNGTRCLYSCRHFCCSTVEELLPTCPTPSPDNPYCIGNVIVNYTIRGRECPVYCSCTPDCRVLTC